MAGEHIELIPVIPHKHNTDPPVQLHRGILLLCRSVRLPTAGSRTQHHGLVQTPEELKLYTLPPIFLLVFASMTPSVSR